MGQLLGFSVTVWQIFHGVSSKARKIGQFKNL